MALIFDDRGNLQPYGVIESNLADFEKTFAFNDLRKALFENYLLYLKDLRAVIGIKTSFFQWLSNPKYGKSQSKGFVQLNF